MNDYEEDEEELGFDEFRRKKRGSGKVPTDTNPLGAGRPSNEWREYQEFLEFKRLREEGITSRGIGDILNGFIGRDESRSDRSGEGTSPKLMGRILTGLGWKEKDIEKIKIDKLDEQVIKTAKWFEPYVMPYVGAVVGIGVVILGWWAAETTVKTETGLTTAEKDEILNEHPGRFIYAKMPPVPIGEIGTWDVTYYRFPRPFHTAVDIVHWLLDAVKALIEDSGGITLFSEYKRKPAQSVAISLALGPFGPLAVWLRKRRQKKKEE